MVRRNYLLIGAVLFLYFFLRFIYPQTIEFGYDQPRLAVSVVEFLKNGNYLNSQKYSFESPWGNFSWGPVLVWINGIFLLFSQNPLTASYLNIIFNSISVLVVVYLGCSLFSKKVGFYSGLILATHPWWIIFSRMVYQPTIVPTLVSVLLLSFFKSVKKPSSWWAFIFILVLGVLPQIYLITLLLLALLGFLFVTNVDLKRIDKKKVGLAFLLLFLSYLPSVYYYAKNFNKFHKFLEFKDRFSTSAAEVVSGFMKTISGGNLRWQLGYGYESFMEKSGLAETHFLIMAIAVVFILLCGFYFSLKEKNKKSLTIFGLFLIPVAMIKIVQVEYVVPRYFLFILPQFSIFLAYSISKLGKASKVILVVLLIFWINLILRYYSFVTNFDYENGFLSNWSDVPYSFLDDSFKYIFQDSKDKGYDSYTLSSDTSFPYEFRFNYSQHYYWRYLLKKEETTYGSVGHYLMYFSPVDERYPKDAQFGPYVVSDVTNSLYPKN